MVLMFDVFFGIVQPDADFECIAVMMEHSQDVKSIAWHPHEEVRSFSFPPFPASISQAFIISRTRTANVDL